VFTVANIQSTSGKSLKTYTKTVGVEDNVAPVLLSAKVLDNKSIELTYSENVTLTDAVSNVFTVGDDFAITVGTTALNLAEGELKAETVSGLNNKVKITIAKGSGESATTLDLTKAIKVVTKGTEKANIKDAQGIVQKAGVEVNVTN